MKRKGLRLNRAQGLFLGVIFYEPSTFVSLFLFVSGSFGILELDNHPMWAGQGGSLRDLLVSTLPVGGLQEYATTPGLFVMWVLEIKLE